MLKNFLSKLFVIAGIAILLSLGIWQLKRMSEKENLIADLGTRSSMPIITPYELSDEYFYRIVEVCGNYKKDKDLFVYFKPNYILLAPFVIQNTGKTILVARGKVMKTAKDKTSILIQNEDSICIQGMLAPPEKEAIFMPSYDGSPKKPMLSINPKSAEDLVSSQLLDMYLISLEPTNSSDISKLKVPDPQNIYNNHLEYALTWFILAGILLFMFVTSCKNCKHKSHKN